MTTSGADDCRHQRLTLLMPKAQVRLRCRHCHLTLSPSEAADGPCPECLATTGEQRADFDQIEVASADIARVRCEDCGMVADAE